MTEYIVDLNSIIVEADSKEEAIDKAMKLLSEDTSYACPMTACEND